MANAVQVDVAPHILAKLRAIAYGTCQGHQFVAIDLSDLVIGVLKKRKQSERYVHSNMLLLLVH